MGAGAQFGALSPGQLSPALRFTAAGRLAPPPLPQLNMSRAGRLDTDVVVRESPHRTTRRPHTAGRRAGWLELRLKSVRKDLCERH